MNDIERAKQQLASSGYVHPSNTNSSADKKYKTFNSEEKTKNVYNSSAASSDYAKFTEKEETLSLGCPICGEDALYACNCEFRDKACKNNHVWYINKDGKITEGDPHENEDIFKKNKSKK